MIVVFRTIRHVEEGGGVHRTDGLNELGVDLILVLLTAIALPLFSGLVGIADIAAAAGGQVARLNAHKAVERAVAAGRQSGQNAELVRRVNGRELQRTAEV